MRFLRRLLGLLQRLPENALVSWLMAWVTLKGSPSRSAFTPASVSRMLSSALRSAFCERISDCVSDLSRPYSHRFRMCS